MTNSASAAEVRLMLHRCGLSPADAGAFLVSPSNGEPTQQRVVRRWLSGEFEIPAHHWQRLQALCDQQDRAAEEQLALIRKLVAEYGEDPREIVIRLSRTQEDADRLGWPTPGAHLAAIRRVVERAPEGLRIIPVYPGEEPAAEAASIARGMID